jgi:hypothetical protein
MAGLGPPMATVWPICVPTSAASAMVRVPWRGRSGGQAVQAALVALAVVTAGGALRGGTGGPWRDGYRRCEVGEQVDQQQLAPMAGNGR